RGRVAGGVRHRRAFARGVGRPRGDLRADRPAGLPGRAPDGVRATEVTPARAAGGATRAARRTARRAPGAGVTVSRGRAPERECGASPRAWSDRAVPFEVMMRDGPVRATRHRTVQSAHGEAAHDPQ